MICLNCSLQPICTIYKNELSKHAGKITVSGCAYHEAASMTEELKKGAKWPPPKNPVTYMVDRNRVADQIRKIKEVQHEECYPVCSEEEKSEHIMTTCEKCGKEFPEWQGVEDAGTKKIVCEDCW